MPPAWLTAPIPTSWTITLAAALFAIGVAGVLTRRNVLVLFLCIELMLNSVNLIFVAFARQLGKVDGQAIVLFSLAVAAAEAAIGLGIVITLFRTARTSDVTDLRNLRE